MLHEREEGEMRNSRGRREGLELGNERSRLLPEVGEANLILLCCLKFDLFFFFLLLLYLDCSMYESLDWLVLSN